MTKREISNSDDVIDSRDVIARIEELREERDSFEFDPDANAAPDGPGYPNNVAAWAGENPDDADELKALESLAEEAKGYAADWKYGQALIRESYFVEYCQEMLEDCGTLPKDLPGFIEIDWDKTAENMKVDYTPVEFDGVTYYIR